MAEMTLIFRRGSRAFAAAGVLLTGYAALAPHVAFAESAPNTTKQQNQDEAVVRYKRALDLFNDGSFDAALLEFRRANELAPNYRVLYNIALVNVQLNDYAAALAAFEQYLADGGSEIPGKRVDEVTHEVARLAPRVATLEVTTDIPGADVAVDDLSVGKAPFAHPIRINAGRRRISVAAEGRVPQARVVEAAGGDALELKFQLVPPTEQPAAEKAPVPPVVPPTEHDSASHPPWFAWTLTGALAAGTAVTGVLALKAHSDQDADKGRLGVSEADLRAAHDKVRNLALATDVLLGATAVVGGLSIYLSVRSANRSHPSDQARLTLLPGGISARIPF